MTRGMIGDWWSRVVLFSSRVTGSKSHGGACWSSSRAPFGLKVLAGKLEPNLGRFENSPDWQEILTYFRGSELQNYFTRILEDNLKVAETPQESAEEIRTHARYKYPNMSKTQGGFKLTVKEGDFTDSQIIVMLGENGTGKTTFIRMLAGLLKPDESSGSETDVPEFNVSYKPQKISPKFENTVRHLLHQKIRDSYMHPQFNTDVMKPLQIESLMDQKVVNLSGGELQQVALCLCLGKKIFWHLCVSLTAHEQKCHSLTAEQLELVKSLDFWAEETILPYLKHVEKCWLPQDYLPEPSKDSFYDEVKELRACSAELPNDYLVVLVGDMITEEALPTYQTMLNTLDGTMRLSNISSDQAWIP